MTICAIHQPNFLPWNGYFDKIRQADIFIFLDEVAYPKSGSGAGSWCNRVKLFCMGSPEWYSLPIKREPGVQLIKDVYFDNKKFHLNKFKKKLEHNYKKAPFYSDVMHLIEPFIDCETDNLADYNINLITELSRLLGLKTQLFRQSELNHESHSTELLIELIKAVGADAYLCGGGASGYQDDRLFLSQGIELIYQNYDPFQDKFFKINSEQEKGLSVLNSLFYQGLPSKVG